jgi:hypothetical protein
MKGPNIPQMHETPASDPSARFVKSGEVAIRHVLGETILVPIRSGVADLDSIFILNEVGTAIWSQIESERSVAQIAGALTSEFDVTPDEAENDARTFLEELRTARLVVSLHDPEVPR